LCQLTERKNLSEGKVVVPNSEETYEVYALRYASREGEKAREYYGFHRYGEPNAPCPLDYFFWLARNDHRTILVDCGYSKDRAKEKGRYTQNHPNNDALETLSYLGVRPDDVDHVVLSHMHQDHVGNVNRFPNATFSMARKEFDFWTGPYGARELPATSVDSDEVGLIKDLLREDRLHFVEDSETLFPGVQATRLGGHTPGQLMTEVAGTSGQVVLASDAIHFYEEMEADRPFWFFCDLEGTYRAYQLFRDLNARPDTSVVPGHDPAVMRKFRPVHPDWVVDLTSPL
jgi:glyoxylase-like metal-dependent hydrolase (beta-lactamase superfamily II)